MMEEGGGQAAHGLMEHHIDLEDDSINFWATLGVSPHGHVVDTSDHHQIALQQPQHVVIVDQPPPPPQQQQQASVCKELFPVEADPRLEPYVGMEFESGEAAKTFYIAYAGRIGFSVRIARSRRSKCSESVIMLRFVCSREGFSKEKRVVAGKKTRKRAASIREGCSAMLEVLRRGDEKWVVTKLVKEHNHEVGMPSRVHYIATEGDAEIDPYIGMEFESLEAAKTFYYSYASRVGFEARVRQSRKSQDESLKMLKLVCSRHRYHSGRDNIGEETKKMQALDPPRDGCDAVFEIIRKDDLWMVSKLILEHTHELNPAPPSKVRCVRSQGEILVIAKNFSDTRNLLLNGQDSHYPREVRYNDLGPEDAQSLLEYLKKTQVENPAFFYAVQVDKNERMTNIFWADAKARMAYYHFGDAVRFETTYRNGTNNIPIVIFSGVNHHAQPVVFGCALLVDESEVSFAWLFENWLEAMPVGPPVSLVTELNQTMAAAVAKVLPDTHHFFCEKHILNTVREELHGLCLEQGSFINDLRKCIEECRIDNSFESCWDSTIRKYGFRNNDFLQSLYDIRHQWAPAYTKKVFRAGVPLPQGCCENLDKVIEKYFTSKTQLRVAVCQLGQAICNSDELEAQADFLTMFEKPALRTASPVEKQAGSIYTRAVFDMFQEQFAESFGYHADRFEDGLVHKYHVTANAGDEETHTVSFDAGKSKVHCSCCLFDSCGILCRHALRVFIIEGVRTLPMAYILKRWTKHAKSSAIVDNYVELRGYAEDPSTERYNGLCIDAIKIAKDGSRSSELHDIAKGALQKALDEVISSKNTAERQMLQSFATSPKKPARKFGKARDSSGKSIKRSASPNPLVADDGVR